MDSSLTFFQKILISVCFFILAIVAFTTVWVFVKYSASRDAVSPESGAEDLTLQETVQESDKVPDEAPNTLQQEVFPQPAGSVQSHKPDIEPSGVASAVPSKDTKDALSDENLAVFSRLGTLRCITADEPPSVLVVTPLFLYTKDDSAFYEELYRKTAELKAIVNAYVASQTKGSLLVTGEEIVKERILRQFNELLVLGKIETLFFNDYIFLD